jgi:hypothetical protein
MPAAPLKGPTEAQEGRQIELSWKVSSPDFEQVQLDPGAIDPPLAKEGDPASGKKLVTPDPAKKDAKGFVTYTLTVFPKDKSKKPQVSTLKIKLGPRPSSLHADLPIDARSALLFCDEAPVAEQAVDAKTFEHAAIWGHVPASFDPKAPSLLVHFHGWDSFVTAAPGAEGGKAPAWLPDAEKNVPKNKILEGNPKLMATGPKYALDVVSETFHPFVLAPEVAVEKPPKSNAAFSVVSSGNLGAAGQFGAMVKDAQTHLQKLTNTFVKPDAPYLPPKLPALSRLFVSAHSGGGVPLSDCAVSDLVMATPTDLILLDCTYGPGTYVDYCTRKGKTRMGNGGSQSRLCAFYRDGEVAAQKNQYLKNWRAEDDALLKAKPDHKPKTDEELGARWSQVLGNSTRHHAEEEIVPNLKKAGFSVSPGTLTKKPDAGWGPEEVLLLNTSDLGVIEDALHARAIVFVRTVGVRHEDHPSTFIEPVLKTASLAPPKPPGNVQVSLVDFAGNPLANKDFTLKAGDDTRSSFTGGDGLLNEIVADGIEEVTVTLDGVAMTLGIGKLKALDDASDEGVAGVQGRLANLGFFAGAVDGQAGPDTIAAAQAFRDAHGLPASDELDQALKDKLREKYGS